MIHTPEPWTLDTNKTHVLDSKGRTIAAVSPGGADSAKQRDANALVLAAAPGLLRALKRIMADLPMKRDWLDPEIEQEARAAIALTEGDK